jgi:hypothetical protein
MIEEWGVGTDPNDDSVAAQVAIFNNAGVPWVRVAVNIFPGASLLISVAVLDDYSWEIHRRVL